MNVHNTMEQIYRHPQNGGWDNYGHSIFHSSREKNRMYITITIT